MYSGIYYYRLKTQHKYKKLDKTLWLTSSLEINHRVLSNCWYVCCHLYGNNKYHYVLQWDTRNGKLYLSTIWCALQRCISPRGWRRDIYAEGVLFESLLWHRQYLGFFSVICSVSSTQPRHQPAATWVNTTRCCKYSQLLLLMGENIARNM
jgi:hypothetical protein